MNLFKKFYTNFYFCELFIVCLGSIFALIRLSNLNVAADAKSYTTVLVVELKLP
jgi:hypothetical protein